MDSLAGFRNERTRSLCIERRKLRLKELDVPEKRRLDGLWPVVLYPDQRLIGARNGRPCPERHQAACRQPDAPLKRQRIQDSRDDQKHCRPETERLGGACSVVVAFQSSIDDHPLPRRATSDSSRSRTDFCLRLAISSQTAAIHRAVPTIAGPAINPGPIGLPAGRWLFE